MRSPNQPLSQDSHRATPTTPGEQMDTASLRPKPTHHMTRRSATPMKIQESDSNLSTPTGPPVPRKKRGRPPGSFKSNRPTKKRMTAISPAVTVSTRNPLLKELVIVFGKVLAFLELMDKNRNAEQRDGVIAPVYDHEAVDSTEESFRDFGDDGTASIDPTSEVGEPGSLKSAKGAASEEVNMNTQVLDDMTSQLVRTIANSRGVKENDSVASVEEGSQAGDKGSSKATETQAALQTSDEAEAASSGCSGGKKGLR